MDAVQALADLTEISSQVEQVAIVDSDGSLLASTARDAVRAERFVSAITRLLDEADSLAKSRGLAELTQLEISTLDGSVFIVRRDGRMVAATTRADPTVGLIFYDLKHCLSSIEPAGGASEALDADATESEEAGTEPAAVESAVTESPAAEPADPEAADPDELEPAATSSDKESVGDAAAKPQPAGSEYTTFVAPRVEPPLPAKDQAESVDPGSEPTAESATNGTRDEPAARTPRKKADTSA